MDNLTPRTFLIDYKVFKNGNEIKSGQIKAKNKKSEFEARGGTGKFLEKKYTNCKIQISKCIDTTLGNSFNNIFSQFGDIFGKNDSSNIQDIFKNMK